MCIQAVTRATIPVVQLIIFVCIFLIFYLFDTTPQFCILLCLVSYCILILSTLLSDSSKRMSGPACHYDVLGSCWSRILHRRVTYSEQYYSLHRNVPVSGRSQLPLCLRGRNGTVCRAHRNF